MSVLISVKPLGYLTQFIISIATAMLQAVAHYPALGAGVMLSVKNSDEEPADAYNDKGAAIIYR